MTTQTLRFYDKLPSFGKASLVSPSTSSTEPRIEPTTCTEAEAFVLQVLDDSMQPEFRRGCIIVIDPTGVAKDGSYVLARSIVDTSDNLPEHLPQSRGEKQNETDGYLFRQLKKTGSGWSLVALNPAYPTEPTRTDLSRITGIIVQRAGTRRRYHKHYD